MIVSLDGLIAGMKPPVPLFKESLTAEGAGMSHSMWRANGNPGAGATPPAFTAGAGYQCTNATSGAIPFVNPTGGAQSILAKVAGVSSSTTGWVLYDRLWTCSGFDTNSIALQSITTPGAIPARDANGATSGDGVEIWGEVYTAPGATGATWTVTYTNQAGVGGRTATYTHPANAESVGQMVPFTLQAGDTGVRAVASFQASIVSGTAGNVGITLVRRLATLFGSAQVPVVLDPLALGSPRIYDSSCLALMALCSTTVTGGITGELVYAQG